jgi:NADPH:quinone reductase-like Zn-dependent oxidoreductase
MPFHKGTYPLGAKKGVVVGSDAAGEVISIGHEVHSLTPGDRVTALFLPTWQDEPLTVEHFAHSIGGMVDGVLQEYGAYDELGLVKVPEKLSYQHASTLAVAAATSWNALFGLSSNVLTAGQWVLIQGSGGVAICALQASHYCTQVLIFSPLTRPQFAKAVRARVIATSSSHEKGVRLKQLGADHVINYRETADWGDEAKRLTGGAGVDHVIEVGGAGTLRQSINAIKMGGLISLIGFMASDANDDAPKLSEVFAHACVVRGVRVATRRQFADMARFIDDHGIVPVVDERVFGLTEVKEAYQYMWDQKHFGKVTVKIDQHAA